MSAIRITIADDSQPTRLLYKRVLETQREFEVVGMAADGEEALEQAMALVPDVVVLDVPRRREAREVPTSPAVTAVRYA